MKLTLQGATFGTSGEIRTALHQAAHTSMAYVNPKGGRGVEDKRHWKPFLLYYRHSSLWLSTVYVLAYRRPKVVINNN